MDEPRVAIVSRGGSPTASLAAIPFVDVSIMLVVDSAGSPVATPVFPGVNGAELRREADSAGKGMVVSPVTKPAKYPGFMYGGLMGIDDWSCNSFSDGFNRGDGAMRSLPNYPWEALLAGKFEIVSNQAKQVGGGYAIGLWEDETSYPAYLAETTYAFPPYSGDRRYGFKVQGQINTEDTTIIAELTTGIWWPLPIYLTFWLFWGADNILSDTWQVAPAGSDMPALVNGQVMTGTSNGYGNVSTTWLGHTFSHQF